MFRISFFIFVMLFFTSGCTPTDKNVMHDPSLSFGQKWHAVMNPAEYKENQKQAARKKMHDKLASQIPQCSHDDCQAMGIDSLKRLLKQNEKFAKEAKARKEKQAKRAVYLKSHPRVAAKVKADSEALSLCMMRANIAGAVARYRDFGMPPRRTYRDVVTPQSKRVKGRYYISAHDAKNLVNQVYFDPQEKLMSPDEIRESLTTVCENPKIKNWKQIR